VIQDGAEGLPSGVRWSTAAAAVIARVASASSARGAWSRSGTGLYFGFDSHHHGEWRGQLHLDGEHIADCTNPATARRIHQIRDALVRVEDPIGGGRGWGNLQTTIVGAWPDEGLDETSSFI
jgi:hypothetical protein